MSRFGDVPISLPSDPAAARPPAPAKGRFGQDELKPFPLVSVAVALAVVVASQVYPDTVPLGTTLRGALLGAGTGLMAVGLVLIYQTTRVINFSFAAMGTFGSAIAAGLKIGQGVPWSIAAPAGVLAGVMVGALVERLVIRRFMQAPRLTPTVATIGLAQLFGGLTYFVPGWFDAPAVQGSFDTRLSGYSVTLFDESFNGNDLVLLAVVPVVLAGLTWFLMRTDAGLAVRGVAENVDRARLLGIPVARLSLLLWSLAGGLAALTVVVQAPNSGNPFDIAAGPTILLPALAAAVVSGMSSLSRAFTVGVGLGALDQIVQANVDKRALTSVVFLAVIVLALLVQRRSGSRALAADETSWSLLRSSRRLPPALARLPEVVLLKALSLLVVVTAIGALLVFGSRSQLFDGTVTVIFAVAALSLVVLMGWGGVVSLGQFAIVGVGGVVAATLIHDRNTDLFLTLAASAVAGGVVALVVGLPALRISGQLLAVTTLAFAVATDTYVFEPANYDGWPPDSYLRPHLWDEVDLASGRWLFVLSLAVLAVTVFATHNLRRARAGRAVVATRDNIRGAASVGVNTVETRLAGFVFAGMFAGVAGGLHAVALEGIPEGTYPVQSSLLLLSMAVIGGSSSVGGVLAGVALVQWAGYLFPSQVQLLMTGVGLLVILWLLPSGLGGIFESVRDRVAYAAARRRGLHLVDELETVEQPVETVTVGFGETWGAAGTGMPPLLSCEGVESSYGSLQVLFGIDTVVGQGELLALLGTNGAGKSTLLRSISGLLPAHDGRVVFDGRDITKLPAEQIARLGLSLMPGGRGVFPTLTVAENLRLASWMLRRDRRSASDARKQAVALFPILRERFGQLAGDLSGGEQQQLSLAMAFVTRPKLLCVDELSLGLAPTVVGQLVDKVREIHASGTSVVVVEQSVNVALLLCERAVFLEKGQVRFRGPTAGLLERPDVLRAVFLGGMDDGHLHPVTHPTQRSSRGVVLECRDLTKRFGGITAVGDVNLHIPPATIVGLIGHNGAGKTTLFDVLTGFLPSDGGKVVLDGRDITGRPPHRRAIRALGRSFQEARLYPSLTVAETLTVAMERHLRNRDPLAAAMRLPASTLSERHARRRVDELVELLGLGQYRDHPTGELSTGTRRIVELGCMLAHDPAVLLLDEPSAGVAQRETEALVPLLRRVQSEAGCSMVVIEHDMALLGSLCDALVCLEEGMVIAWGAPDDVLQDHRVVASYLGTDHEVVHRSGPGFAPHPSPWSLPRRSPAGR